MNNQIKIFQEKIRKYNSLPSAIVIDYKSVAYPFYVLDLDLTFLQNRDLELFEEFVMKCVNNGLSKVGEISGFLGVDNHITEKVLSELISRNLIKREDELKLTQDGLDALQKQTISAPVSETKTFYLDALNGKLSDNFNLKNFDDEEHSQNSINKIIKKPRKNNVEDLVDYYESIEKSLQNPNNSNYIELIQVNKIEKVYTQWHEIEVVLYKNSPNDEEIEYETFSRDSIQKEYREIIQQLKTEGKNILAPIFQETKQYESEGTSFTNIISNISDEDIKNVEQISVKMSSLDDSDSFSKSQTHKNQEEKQKLKQQLKELKNKTRISEVVHTYEIREYLLKALKEAKNRVMIVSPWIKRNVVNHDFISSLKDTLKRNVKIYIIYGIKGSSFQNDRWSIQELERLMSNYENFTFQETANSHRKQIVCDQQFAIVASFNFLSFRADPDLTYRDELGVVLRDKQTIQDLFNSGLSLIDN